MGLFEHPYGDLTFQATIGSADHRAIAREAVQESLVLLTNDGALPVAPSTRTIVVVGNAADDMGIQAGGWTMSWQGDTGPVIVGTTIRQGIADRAGSDATVTGHLPTTGQADLCIAVVGETPYAEGMGDSTDLALPGLEVVDTLEGKCAQTVLVVVSGRPVIIGSALDHVDAAVAAWLPGTAGEGVADVLFGDVPFTGSLPMNWPRDLSQVPTLPGGDAYLFPIGYGLTS
jgi:beta-glucosidase